MSKMRTNKTWLPATSIVTNKTFYKNGGLLTHINISYFKYQTSEQSIADSFNCGLCAELGLRSID